MTVARRKLLVLSEVGMTRNMYTAIQFAESTTFFAHMAKSGS